MDRSGYGHRDYDGRSAELRSSWERHTQDYDRQHQSSYSQQDHMNMSSRSHLQDSLRKQQAHLQQQERSPYDELSRRYQESSYTSDRIGGYGDSSDHYGSRYQQALDSQDRYQDMESRYNSLASRSQMGESRYDMSDSRSNLKPDRYDAVQQKANARTQDRKGKDTTTNNYREKSEKERKLAASKEVMMKSYGDMMKTYSRQQQKLAARPSWKMVNTRDAEEPDELTVTHVNHTFELNNPALLETKFSENMSSEEWLKAHSIEHMKLTIKDLMDRGTIGKPDVNPDTKKVRQHVQFEANDINEFEYKLNLSIEKITNRIKWLLQGSRRYFGLVKGQRVGVMIDASDANCGFGRLSGFQEALTHLLDEQLSKKKGIFLQCFGTQPLQLWNDTMDVNCRSIEEAKQWLDALTPSGGSNVLRALKVMTHRKDIDSILLIVGSTPDQAGDILAEYVEELIVGRSLPIQTVAYDCNNPAIINSLKQIASSSGGRFHCYGSSNQEMLYNSSDVALLLNEIQKAQETIAKIKDMRQGLLGTALVSVMNEIGKEVAKLPQSRFLPRPPGHEDPLRIEVGSFQPSSSYDWLAKHGLKAKNLDLYQVLAPNAYSFKEEFIPVIRKTVHSQVHGSAMAQFQWYDGTMKNVHVDMTQLFEYQKQLGAAVSLYEKRIDWLGSGTRKTFGTVTENRVVILVDLSVSNLKYLVHIQHSLRLLLEQQMANKDYFNIIGFGSEATKFRPTMVKPTPENLQAAWKFVLNMQCGGSRNFMDAFRQAVENDAEADHNIDVEGIYLFISGIPDQQSDICNNYVEESTGGRGIKVHGALFNVDDYDSQGAIPSRYANITKTAECLRNMAHCSGGRFHWFRETGIIESDDIATVSLEIEKALNFSKKCSMLVNSVKKKYGLGTSEMRALTTSSTPLALPSSETLRALPPPKHTVLTQTRIEKAAVTEASKTLFRPSSATSRDGDNKAQNGMSRVKGRKVQKAFFYTDDKQGSVGSVFSKYPSHKTKVNPIKAHSIPDKEEQHTTREWLRKYSLQRLKLNLNKLVTGPETRQTVKPIKVLKKSVESKVYRTFPSINVNGQLQYLQLQPRELREYENQVEHVLHRYLKRLQWLLSGSRRVFGTVVEKKSIFLIDTSGSMDPYMEELKKEIASLIWDQLHKNRIKFNLISFSRGCEMFEEELVEASEENCHRAVEWASQLAASGNTCTLEALELAFGHINLEAVYLFTDGKPDTSTSLVLKEVANMNQERGVVVNTISFNCEDVTANNFLKMLATQTSGRYHRCHSDFDAQKFAHKLLTEGFHDHEYPPLPDFEGDDLKKLGSEITAARKFLSQSHQYRQIYEDHQRKISANESEEHLKIGPGPERGRPKSAKV